MHIAMPMNKSVPVIPRPGTKFYGRALAQGTIWQFTCIFVDKNMVPVPIWICELPFALIKVQLRSFVRLPAALPLKFKILSDSGDPVSIGTTTRDISGGGLQLITKKDLPVGTILHLWLDLPEFGPVATKATIVRSDQPPDTNIYWVATKFTEIVEKDREKIIKFIFKKQSELRQKGL